MKNPKFLFTVMSLFLTTGLAFGKAERSPAEVASSDEVDSNTAAALAEKLPGGGEKPNEYSAEDLVVPSPKIYRVIKSNPKHFADFFNKRAQEFLRIGSNDDVSFAGLLEFKGLVFEDSHTFNFGDVHFPNKGEAKKGTSMFGPIDFDDFRSNGPLLESLLKKMTTDKAYSPKEVSLKKVYENYLRGLQDGLSAHEISSKSWPEAVTDALDLPFSQVLNEMSAYAKKRTKEGDKIGTKELDNAKAGTTPIKKSPSPVQLEYTKSKGFFAEKMSEYKILDVGYGTRDSGSSKGMMRFLFLVSKKDDSSGNLYLFEFKQKATAAAEELFHDQPEADRVFEEVRKVYYDNDVDPEFLEVVKSPTGLFYEKRMRGNNRIALNEKNFIEVSYFEAYWEGLTAARQSDDYAKAMIQADKAGFFEAVARPLAKKYLETLVVDVNAYITKETKEKKSPVAPEKIDLGKGEKK